MNLTVTLGHVFLFFFFTLIGYGCGYHRGYKDAVKAYREIYRKMSDEDVKKYRDRIYGKDAK